MRNSFVSDAALQGEQALVGNGDFPVQVCWRELPHYQAR
jgi:hypothetical protein